MPVRLIAVARMIIIACLTLAGCTGNAPTTRVTPTIPNAIDPGLPPADPTSHSTDIPRSTPSPSSTAIQEPTTSPTFTATFAPTPAIIRLDNLDLLTPLYTLDLVPSKVTALAFSPDSTILAIGTDFGPVSLWNVGDGALLFTLSGHSDVVNSLAFSPDGQLLASASSDQSVRIWWTEDGSLVKTIKTELIGKALKVEFSRDGSLIAIAGNLCYIILRDTDTGIMRRTLKQPHCLARTGGQVQYWGLAFSPDEVSLFTGEGQPGGRGGSIQVWEYESNTPPQTLRGYDLVVRDLSLSPDGATLAVALSGAPEIWLVSVLDGSLIRQLEGHTFRVNAVDYSTDGSLLASAGREGTVRLWDPASGESVFTFKDHTAAVNSVAFSPDGRFIASASDDGMVIVRGYPQP